MLCVAVQRECGKEESISENVMSAMSAFSFFLFLFFLLQHIVLKSEKNCALYEARRWDNSPSGCNIRE